MGVPAVAEWRCHDDALALDQSLLESVFRQLARQHEGNQFDGDQSSVDQLLFPKSDVLKVLETTGLFLEKRPMLRSLHTRIACVSSEKESGSLAGFVRCRQRDHTISCAMVKKSLAAIYAAAREKEAFEKQVFHFQQQAKASSPWCVRNWKCVVKRPSQFYGVHDIPPKPKSDRQLEQERIVRTILANQVTSSAVQTVIEKLMPPSTTTKSTARQPKTRQVELSDSVQRSSTSSRSKLDDQLRSRAKTRREQAEREDQRRRLRLELFAPHFVATCTSHPEFAQVTVPQAVENNGVEELSDRTENGKRLEEMLALVEAIGDVRLARTLLEQKIPRSGFRRAIEQAHNLNVPSENKWEVVKIWRSVYRTRIVQALQGIAED